MSGTRAVIALGGNTLLGDRGMDTYAAQRERIDETAAAIAAVIEAGHEVVLTHGNGPQVGNLLLQQAAAPETPQLPLDVLVAETQAQIGYLLQQSLDNALGGGPDFVTVVTQVTVDPADPAFDDPTKPVGPFYTEADARTLPFETRRVRDDERPFRRVVPSPDPVEIVEGAEIARLVDEGALVICAGGGGVPVTRDDGLRGVEAVVDKDRTAALLGNRIGADRLVVLTDVPYAYRGFGSDAAAPIREATPSTLSPLLRDDTFGAGSMRPKVEACVDFVRDGGGRAVITTPEHLLDGIAGDAGTQIRPDG